MKRITVILVIATWFTQPGVARQDEPNDSLMEYLTFNDTPPLACLLTYFPSLFIQHGMDLKEFITSKSFQTIRRRFGDPRAADAIYVRAMQMTENNTAVSLMISMIACFDHEMVGIKIPVFSLYFPLTDESHDEFERRVRCLPAKLYDDTPQGPYGDRDKLQHFFGSAFITFIGESREAAMRVGEFVEKGEDAFIIGGVNDDRDLRADMQGQQFGLALLENNRRLPTDFLKTQLASHIRQFSAREQSACCLGAW